MSDIHNSPVNLQGHQRIVFAQHERNLRLTGSTETPGVYDLDSVHGHQLLGGRRNNIHLGGPGIARFYRKLQSCLQSAFREL